MANQPTHAATLARTTPTPTPTPAAPRGERGSPWRRSAAVVRRWARDTFSREQLASSLRSLVWVVPLTLFIWIYAEREQQDEQVATIEVTVTPVDPAKHVARLAEADGTASRAETVSVRPTLRGPKARVSQVIDKLRAMPTNVPIAGRDSGTYNVELRGTIESNSLLHENGVSVVDVEPASVRVVVEALREEEVDVNVSPEVRQLLNGVAFVPPRVTVSAPASAMEKLTRPLTAQAAIRAPLPPELSAPGPHPPVHIAVQVPGLSGPNVTIRPGQVIATLNVKDAVVPYKIDSLPVRMVATGSFNREFNVEYDEFLKNVTVWGAPDIVQQLKAGQLAPKPAAAFQVFSEDAIAGGGTKKLDYALPEGITIRDEDRQSIPFKVTRRDVGQ